MTQRTAYEHTQLSKYGKDPFGEYGTQPIEYVTGWMDFCGLTLRVSPHVLIPRVETEQLVELACTHMETLAATPPVTEAGFDAAASPLVVAEVGAGSGAITAACASHAARHHLPTQFVAGDISAQALALAVQNLKQHCPTYQLHTPQSASSPLCSQPQPRSISLIHSDLLTSFPLLNYSIIIANLPYIPHHRLATLDPSVRDHEPLLALDGGPDGFTLIRTLIKQATAVLHQHAVLLLEIDHTHTEHFWRPFTQDWNVQLITDYRNELRFAELTRR